MLSIPVVSSAPYKFPFDEFFMCVIRVFPDHSLVSVQGRNVLNASLTAVAAFYLLERIIMSVHAFLS